MTRPARKPRYHPALVTLHWLVAALLTLSLGSGLFFTQAPPTLRGLATHMACGLLILALMTVRLLVRVLWPPPSAGLSWVTVVHWGLYALVVATACLGLATALLAGLLAVLFSPIPLALPQFDAFPTLTVHARLALLLAAAIVTHTLGVLLRDTWHPAGVLNRMGYGPARRRVD